MSERREYKVRDLLEPRPYSVTAGNSVAGFLAEIGRERGHSTAALPVMRNGAIAGVISVGLASQVAHDKRSGTGVEEVMLGADNAITLDPDTSLVEADEALRGEHPSGVVVEDGKVLGVVTLSLVSQALQAARSRAQKAGE